LNYIKKSIKPLNDGVRAPNVPRAWM